MRLFSSRKQNNGKLQSLTDEQLVIRYAGSGDAECLGVLYERYTHLMFALCMKYLGREQDAEDMVMQIFEKLFVELKKTEVKNFKPWLYTVARNQCLMYLRHYRAIEKNSMHLLQALESEIMESPAEGHLTPGENNGGDAALLESAILHLNEGQKLCIELFYLREKSYQEVSDATGYTMHEVKSHIQNGKRNLRIFIEKARK